jgi:hypothetical protein
MQRINNWIGRVLPMLIVLGLGSASTLVLQETFADEGAKMIRVVRIYTGPDNQSHFEDIDVPLKEAGKIGFLSEMVKAPKAWCSARPRGTTTTNSTLRRGGNTW